MNKSINTLLILLALIIALFTSCEDEGDDFNYSIVYPTGPTRIGDSSEIIIQFEEELEYIRKDLKIPGMSAAIVHNKQLIWAKGFGHADIENNIPARPTTSYHLASLTKTFAAIIIMQLVEEELLNLEEPVSNYGIQLESQGTVRVKHLLTHTSEGIPGDNYKYNGSRFGLLDHVIIGASGKTFCELLVERIIDPLQLKNTAPNVLSDNCMLTGQERIDFAWNLAQGYTSDGKNTQSYPSYFGTAAGLVSSVVDMATYSAAIDNTMFLSEETWEKVFSPTISNSGDSLAYGIGWFVDYQHGSKILWHYGWWDAISSLIIKVPDKELDFIIMANTDMLSRASSRIGTDNDITRSIVGIEFLDAFIFN
jgi:CubicO group peptidase (beta-lactamase class C family)